MNKENIDTPTVSDTAIASASMRSSKPAYSPFLLPLAILLAGVLISATLLYTRGTAGPTKPKLKIEKNDIVLGNPRAKAIVYEYTDFQCPFCRKFFVETWPQLKQEYIDTGKVRFVIRQYPLEFHPMAAPAAQASECAQEQGKFLEFHDAVFNGQVQKDSQKFSKTIMFTQNDLTQWETTAGLDLTALNTCLVSKKFEAKVKSDQDTGAGLGVRGTPSFFIGETFIEGAYPFATYQDAIEKLLAK